jgi:hypothetical protein
LIIAAGTAAHLQLQDFELIDSFPQFQTPAVITVHVKQSCTVDSEQEANTATTTTTTTLPPPPQPKQQSNND